MITPAAVGRPRGPIEELETRAPRRTGVGPGHPGGRAGRHAGAVPHAGPPAGYSARLPGRVRRLLGRLLPGPRGAARPPPGLGAAGQDPRIAASAPWLGALALLVPPLGAVGTELLPALRGADPALFATACAVAAVNATGEELLWRGLFVAAFPDDPVRGWLWPAIGFTVWHLAPASVRPPRRGRLFLAGSALIGAGFGWVAWRTRSLRLTLPAHVVTDASGLSAARFWLGRQSTSS
jgi:membrane protease YdiL (CAAX protease family)